MNNKQEKLVHTKVVGVTYEARQSIIGKINHNAVLQLVREPDNPYDKNAVSVYCSGELLGYLDRQLAKEVGPGMDQAKISSLPAFVEQVTGIPGQTRGLNITFTLPSGAVKRHKPAWLIGIFYGFCFACLGASVAMQRGIVYPEYGFSGYVNNLVYSFVVNFIVFSLIATLLVKLFRTRPVLILVVFGTLISILLVFYIIGQSPNPAENSPWNTVEYAATATTDAARNMRATQLASEPTKIPKPTAPKCLTWADVGLDDVGKELCIYGKVLTAYTKNDIFYMTFSREVTDFYMVSYGGWYEGVKGNCVLGKGEIKQIGQAPIMIIDDKNFFHCE